MSERAIDPADFREVMGQYPTGVVVITALAASGEALGMTVGSFNSVSLDPTLVMFMPDKSSSSWKALREAGAGFGVNVLSAEQEPVCRAVATRKEDKFDGIKWWLSDGGNPVIEDCVAHLDCQVEAIHEGGDHDIVIGRVTELGVLNPVAPLLFYRGGYGSFAPRSLATADADLLDQLRLIDSVRTMMDDLAAELDTEVTASCLVRNELVLAAASGRPRSGELSQVGRRVAFRPPFGSVFAAWSPPQRREQWLRAASPVSEAARERFLEMSELVRTRGYGLTLPHGGHRGDWIGYNPTEYRKDQAVESITAPVFGANGEVAFALTIWGGPVAEDLPTAMLVERITETARNATAAIGGRTPTHA